MNAELLQYLSFADALKMHNLINIDAVKVFNEACASKTTLKNILIAECLVSEEIADEIANTTFAEPEIEIDLNIDNEEDVQEAQTLVQKKLTEKEKLAIQRKAIVMKALNSDPEYSNAVQKLIQVLNKRLPKVAKNLNIPYRKARMSSIKIKL